MNFKIEKAAVLGSGVMGSAIAAHLAGVGIPCLMLDIVPNDATETTRNKLSLAGRENALKSKPATFFSKKDADLITCGNFEDNMQWVGEVDWIIEVVMENLEIKKQLLSKIAKHWKKGTIISSNTSGISIAAMSEHLSQNMQSHFLGTHFFNPVRYMKLLEIIPGPKTKKPIIKFMAEFGERVLGKGIVYAKDTPNFIANRIGVYGMASVFKSVVEDKFGIDEIDEIMGLPMGRPKSAIFGTADIVGLDTLSHVMKNVYDTLVNDPKRDIFVPPEFFSKMVEKGLLGRKSKSGFFKLVKGEGKSETLVINPETLEYEPVKKLDAPSLKSAKEERDVRKKIKKIVYADDRAGQYAWKAVKNAVLYSINLIPEISDDIVNIDNAMKWGFNWELGPFETWDAIGVKESVERLEKEGEVIPEKVEQLLKKGESFYKTADGKEFYFDFETDDYKPLTANKKIIDINIVKSSNPKNVVAKNTCASLINIGDGVACLQFHSELQPDMNPIDDQILEMMFKSIEIVKKDFVGLVIANQSKNFCAGANLMLLAMNSAQKNWDAIEKMVKSFQDANQGMKFAPFPVVAAPHQMTLGGGCEVCLGADRIRPAAETYIGLVEVGVGLIPAGGGCKELVVRCTEGIPDGVDVSTTRFVGRAFQAIATAQVATSAKEAIEIGFLRKTDKISTNNEHRIYDAKNTVLGMVKEGYQPPRERKDIRVPGRDGWGALANVAWTMHQGGYATDHDLYLAKKVAYIVTGGDVSEGTLVSEQYLLDLEREVFLHLCGHEKSLARMQHFLMKKKPLRN